VGRARSTQRNARFGNIHKYRPVARCATDDTLNHVGQPLGLVENPVHAVPDIATLTAGQQQDGRQRLA